MNTAARPDHSQRWRLVGPWYRWARAGVPADAAAAPPAIQMFAGDDFIERFLAQPQHSLKADALVDHVQAWDLVAAGSFAGRLLALFPLKADGTPAPAKVGGATNTATVYRARPAPGALRKLYQPTHDRHYVCTCELHCNEPGFPRVARQQVCQAGFVVRRVKHALPTGVTAADLDQAAAPVRKAEADWYDLVQLDKTAQALDMLGQPDTALRTRALAEQARRAGSAGWAAHLEAARTGVDTARLGFAAWLKDRGVTTDVQGWFPALEGDRPSPTRGAWRTLRPHEIDADPYPKDPTQAPEHVTPLRPLVPDPREPGHDAAGRTFFHGLVPTQSLQHDAAGLARFDDRDTYVLRCFVREHHPCPPKTGLTPDCDGPVVWSLPSEPFRVASPMDVQGSANRPITIRMPDLRDLAAAAAQRPRGTLSPVRFSQPQHMSPKGEGGDMGGEAICSFSIPLITIVALFLLNLFLPIVVFIFQLWFLLLFRFCIPPQFQATAAIDTAMKAVPPGVDLTADFAIRADWDAPTAEGLLKAALGAHIVDDTGKTDEAPDLTGQGAATMGPVVQSMADNASLTAPPGGSLPAPPATGTEPEYEAHVSPQWTLAGGRA